MVGNEHIQIQRSGLNFVEGFEEGTEDLCRELRYDAIPRKAPEVSSSGHPINQQAKAGFGAPRFAVVAGDPFGIGPEGSVAAIWRGSWSRRLRPSGPVVAIPALSFQSRAEGVTQGDA